MTNRLRRAYGAGPLHLVLMVLTLAMAGYAVWVMSVSALWNSETWWQSIAVWFVGAAVVHDLVVFPLYAAGDRALQAAARHRGPARGRPKRLWLINYVRAPLAAIALLFVVFFPGILGQGSDSYQAATGQTQEPFLVRWLLLSAAIVMLSALAYVLQVVRVRQEQRRSPYGG